MMRNTRRGIRQYHRNTLFSCMVEKTAFLGTIISGASQSGLELVNRGIKSTYKGRTARELFAVNCRVLQGEEKY